MARPNGTAIKVDTKVTIIDPTIIGLIPNLGLPAVGFQVEPVMNFKSPYSLTNFIPSENIKNMISKIRNTDITADKRKII